MFVDNFSVQIKTQHFDRLADWERNAQDCIMEPKHSKSFLVLLLHQWWQSGNTKGNIYSEHHCRNTPISQDKWRGVLHHVCDKNEWYQGECEHDALTEPPTNTYGIEIPYFVRGDSDFKLLQKILTDKKRMFSLKYFTRFRCWHTSTLENFHNTMLLYCSKRNTFNSIISFIILCIITVIQDVEPEFYLRCKITMLMWTAVQGSTSKHVSTSTTSDIENKQKNWDLVKILEAKEYKCIPDLMKAIQHNWEWSVLTMKSKHPVDAQHPVNIQRTIAHTQPPDTHNCQPENI